MPLVPDEQNMPLINVDDLAYQVMDRLPILAANHNSCLDIVNEILVGVDSENIPTKIFSGNFERTLDLIAWKYEAMFGNSQADTIVDNPHEPIMHSLYRDRILKVVKDNKEWIRLEMQLSENPNTLKGLSRLAGGISIPVLKNLLLGNPRTRMIIIENEKTTLQINAKLEQRELLFKLGKAYSEIDYIPPGKRNSIIKNLLTKLVDEQ